ncbi:MAG: FHA domain-containing protein [Caldilineaceae bacterium]
MSHRLHVLHLLLFVVMCSSAIVEGFAPAAAFAQTGPTPALQIRDVDTSQSPLVTVTILGENLPESIATLPAKIVQDGQEVAVTQDNSIQTGIEFIVAIDSNELSATGKSGQSRFVELTGALLDLIDAEALIRNQDWLAAYLVNGGGALQEVQTWTQEPNLIFNSIVQNPPAETTGTPLTTAGVLALLDQFDAAPASSMLARRLLLFSTSAPTLDLTQITARATAAHVQIHVVEVGSTDPNATPQTNLQQLAEQSGGHYVLLAFAGELAPLWARIAADHAARQLTFQTDLATAQNVEVQLQLPDGALVRAQLPLSLAANQSSAAPVTIQLESPPANAQIDWTTLPDLPTAATPTKQLPVQATFTWPAAERSLTEVVYTLQGPNNFSLQETVTAAPFDHVLFPLEAPAAGAYTLAVRATDELQITNAAEPVTFQLVNVPAEAPAVPAEQQTTSLTVAAPASGGNVATTASTANESAALPANAATASAGTNTTPTGVITIPGTQVGIPRLALLIALPVLLVLMVYFVYVEIRSRRGGQARRTGAQSMQSDPFYALSENSRPVPSKRFAIDDDTSQQEKPRRSSAPAKPTPSSAAPLSPPPTTYADDYGDYEEATVVPPRMEDDDATYRLTQEVEQPIVGYLVRVTSDPNLPKELPIFSLNPAPGEARQIHVGRHSKHNTIVINDKSVSREHAVIIQKDGRLYLRDNASTAGTFLNWKRLNPGEELLLRHNDVISLGQIVYEFRVHGEDEVTIANP